MRSVNFPLQLSTWFYCMHLSDCMYIFCTYFPLHESTFQGSCVRLLKRRDRVRVMRKVEGEVKQPVKLALKLKTMGLKLESPKYGIAKLAANYQPDLHISHAAAVCIACVCKNLTNKSLYCKRHPRTTCDIKSNNQIGIIIDISSQLSLLYCS